VPQTLALGAIVTPPPPHRVDDRPRSRPWILLESSL
jgi:hypothetical protein